MLGVNKCELCNNVVTGNRAAHKQTKYCDTCAKQKKRENTESPWTPEQKRNFQRRYMRDYRSRHPGLSSAYVRKHREKGREAASGSTNLASFAGFLPFLFVGMLSSGKLELNIDAIPEAIGYLELLAVKMTGLVIVGMLCWRHLASLWKSKPK